MPDSQLPDVFLTLAEFLSFEDVTSLAITSVSTLRTLEAVSRFLSSSALSGIELFGWHPVKGALFQQLQESMQPQILMDIRWCENRKQQSSFTVPMPLVVETSGRFFVKFWVSAGKASNGCPSVGVVDAEEVRQDPQQLNDDLSRPVQASDTFGISCNPYSGRIHTSHTSKVCKQLMSETPVQGARLPRSWTAEVISWESGESSCMGRRRASIEVGMIISNGTLEYVRHGPAGWESSGVVWNKLPAKILCCVFLFDFVGEAIVSVEETCSNRLPTSAQTQCSASGRLSSWTSWPPAC